MHRIHVIPLKNLFFGKSYAHHSCYENRLTSTIGRRRCGNAHKATDNGQVFGIYKND